MYEYVISGKINYSKKYPHLLLYDYKSTMLFPQILFEFRGEVTNFLAK